MLSPPRVVSRSLAELPSEASRVGLVMLAAPACGTGGLLPSPYRWHGVPPTTCSRHRPPAPSHHRHQCSFPLLAGRSRAGDARLSLEPRPGIGLSDSVSTGAGHLPCGSIRPLQLDQSRPPMRAHRTARCGRSGSWSALGQWPRRPVAASADSAEGLGGGYREGRPSTSGWVWR